MFRVALFILIVGCIIYLFIGFWVAMLVAGTSSLSSASIKAWDFIKIMFFWIFFIIVGK
jgi:hypothetical protein